MNICPINNNFHFSKLENKYLAQISRNIADEPKEDLTFKGKEGDFIGRFFGKHYAKPMMEKEWTRNLSERLSKLPGNMTEHMATLGSLITSSVYMGRTLTNKELDPQKRRTLSINQCLCFIIPTICAYTVNSMLAGFNKKLEYRYAGRQEMKKALGLVSGDKIVEMQKKLGDRLKGFKTLSSLLTFTLIYRYVTPVIITPVANYIGDKVNKRSDRKRAERQQLALA